MSVQLSDVPASSAPHGGQSNEFPPELVEHVALYLSPREIAQTQSVAKHWTLDKASLSKILITRIQSTRGRISTYDLQASVALLGKHSHHARVLINLIKTLEFMTSQPCHLDLRKALQLEELEFSPDTQDDNICTAPALKGIRKLNFSHCNQLTDYGFLNIVGRYPNTHSINFYPSVTNEGLAIAVQRFHENLRTIQLISPPSGRIRPINRGLMWIANNCPNLMQLHLEVPYGEVRDESVIGIANNCHQLRKLHLVSLNITDESLIAIAAGCPQLKELHFENLREISKMGILTLINGCPNLSKVSLKSLTKITAEDVAEIASQCEHIPQLNLQEAPKYRWSKGS